MTKKKKIQHERKVRVFILWHVVLAFEFVDVIIKCDHSNQSYSAVLACGTVYYAVQGGESDC